MIIPLDSLRHRSSRSSQWAADPYVHPGGLTLTPGPLLSLGLLSLASPGARGGAGGAVDTDGDAFLLGRKILPLLPPFSKPAPFLHQSNGTRSSYLPQARQPEHPILLTTEMSPRGGHATPDKSAQTLLCNLLGLS